MRISVRFFVLVVLFSAVIVVSLSIGSVMVPPATVLGSLFGSDGMMADVVRFVRLPRLLLACAIGASLALSGVVFQAVLKNPLADPYIMGVSGGAAFGAAVATIGSGGIRPVSFSAFLGSLCAVSVVYLLSRLKGFGRTAMVLAGLAMSFVLSSAVLLLFSLLRSEEVHRVLMWLMGDLSSARFGMSLSMLVFAGMMLFLLMVFHRRLDIIAFGDEFAHSLGVGRGDLFALFWIGSLLAAFPVAVAGIIGFVGLVVPHIARFFFGPRHLLLIPSSALCGAMLLSLADAIGKSIAPPYEVPAGVILGFLGGLFFLVLLVRGGE
jgi:iron complex transport system permease protein